MKNYYEVLEITVDASSEEIHQAYIRAKNAYSGDSLALYSLMSEEDCHSMIEKIEEAYSILGEPSKRKEYNRVRGLISDTKVQRTAQPRMENNDAAYGLLPSMEATATPQREYHLAEATMESFQSTQPQRQQRRPERSHFASEEEFNLNKREVSEISRITATKRFSLDYDRDSQFENEIENATNFTGELLRRIREYKKVDIPRMANMTKVSKTYIQHIENDDYDKLPALAYVRGFVFQYAKCLRLSPDLTATSYIAHIKSLIESEKKSKTTP